MKRSGDLARDGCCFNHRKTTLDPFNDTSKVIERSFEAARAHHLRFGVEKSAHASIPRGCSTPRVAGGDCPGFLVCLESIAPHAWDSALEAFGNVLADASGRRGGPVARVDPKRTAFERLDEGGKRFDDQLVALVEAREGTARREVEVLHDL